MSSLKRKKLTTSNNTDSETEDDQMSVSYVKKNRNISKRNITNDYTPILSSSFEDDLEKYISNQKKQYSQNCKMLDTLFQDALKNKKKGESCVTFKLYDINIYKWSVIDFIKKNKDYVFSVEKITISYMSDPDYYPEPYLRIIARKPI